MACLIPHLPIYTYLLTYLSIYLFTYLPICLFAYLPINLSTCTLPLLTPAGQTCRRRFQHFHEQSPEDPPSEVTKPRPATAAETTHSQSGKL